MALSALSSAGCSTTFTGLANCSSQDSLVHSQAPASCSFHAPVSARCPVAGSFTSNSSQVVRTAIGWSSSNGWGASKKQLTRAVNERPSFVRARACGVVCMSLPAGKWSARAIKSFSMAELEARKLKYPTTGTEALIMGMLTEGTGEAARFLRANGVTLFGVRDETLKLLGKADMYFFSPEHPALTEPAHNALQWAIQEHSTSGGEGEITTEYILLGIWFQKGSAGQQILTTLGMDDAKIEECRQTIGKQPVRS